MSHRIINVALSEHLSLLGMGVQYENAPPSAFTPIAGQLYLSEFYLPSDTTPIGLVATDTDDYVGLYQVNVHAPKDSHKATGLSAALRILRHFAPKTVLTKDGIRILIERADQLPAIATGDRWVIGTRMRFRCLTRAQ